MRDRLADLTINYNVEDVSISVESHNIPMDEFFKTVGEVRCLVEKISSQLEEVVKKHSAILSAPNPEEKTKNELEQLTNHIKGNANAVRAKLKTIQDSLPEDENANTASVDQRIQKNQHTNLTRWFVDVMTSYNETQVSFRVKCKARIQRQLEINHLRLSDHTAGPERDRVPSSGHHPPGVQHQGAARHVCGHGHAGGDSGGDDQQHREERHHRRRVCGLGQRGDQEGGEVPEEGAQEVCHNCPSCADPGRHNRAYRWFVCGPA
ncbi:syntaxin-1A-like isoform X3 [Osmerus mordax]|uniref:syntaxin-1A-like isoform X3 n=1 Tax=Osmerus mordax TaxID=8014 RepID=UPI0035106F87